MEGTRQRWVMIGIVAVIEDDGYAGYFGEETMMPLVKACAYGAGGRPQCNLVLDGGGSVSGIQLWSWWFPLTPLGGKPEKVSLLSLSLSIRDLIFILLSCSCSPALSSFTYIPAAQYHSHKVGNIHDPLRSGDVTLCVMPMSKLGKPDGRGDIGLATG